MHLSSKNFKVINLGVSAVNSNYFVQNFKKIKELKPQLIISMIGINDRESILNSNDQNVLTKFLKYSKIYQLAYWSFEYLNNIHLEKDRTKLRYFQSKREQLQQEFLDYLAVIPDHHTDYFEDFDFKLKTKESFKDYPFEEWITLDIKAEVLGKISLSKDERGIFKKHQEYLLKSSEFYALASLHFIKQMQKQKVVGLEAPWIFTQIKNIPALDFDKILNFYKNHFEEIYLPESSSSIQTAIFFPKTRSEKFKYGYEVLKENYLLLEELAKQNKIELLPMQYPKLDPQWIAKLFNPDAGPFTPGIFMCSDPYSEAKKNSFNKLVISNENIREFCPQFAKECFFDNFHQCNTAIDYNFGHAGKKLNDLIATNAANFIKTHWNEFKFH